jgi:hypothetical protein
MTLTCPMCKKEIEQAANSCPRCRTDLKLLVEYMSNLDEQMSKAEAAMKAGELGDAVWAYLNVLETDPENAVARKQVNKVATAVRQFDDAKQQRRTSLLMSGAGIGLGVLLVLGLVFYLGYYYGSANP